MPENQSHQQVKMAKQAFIVNIEDEENKIRKVPLNQLPEERKRIGEINDSIDENAINTIEYLYNKFINTLLRPKEWKVTSENIEFPFSIKQVILLIEETIKVIQCQPMVLKLRAPIKIFGDIHGQYNDLMRFFDLYGSPIEEDSELLLDTGIKGDIDTTDYLFLGD